MECEIHLNIDYICFFPPHFTGERKDAMCSLRCESPDRQVSADVASGDWYILLNPKITTWSHGTWKRCSTSGDLLPKINKSKGFPVTKRHCSKIHRKST